MLIWGTAEGLVQESNRRRAGVGADILIRPSTSSSTTSRAADLSDELVDEIEALPEVDIVVGTIVQLQSDATTVTGVRIEKFGRMAGGLTFIDGGTFEDRFDALVDQTYAQHMKLAVGDTLRVLNRDFRVTGITETGKLSRVFVPLETMQELTGDVGKLSQIYVKLRDPEQTQAVIENLRVRSCRRTRFTRWKSLFPFSCRRDQRYGPGIHRCDCRDRNFGGLHRGLAGDVYGRA